MKSNQRQLWRAEGESGVAWCAGTAYPVFTSIGLATKSKPKAVKQALQWMKKRGFLFAARVSLIK